MISSPAGKLAELLRSNDLDWLLKSSGAEEQTLAPLLRRLNDLTDAFQSRFGHRVSFCPEQLRFEFGRNPHRIRAFTFGDPSSRNAIDGVAHPSRSGHPQIGPAIPRTKTV